MNLKKYSKRKFIWAFLDTNASTVRRAEKEDINSKKY